MVAVNEWTELEVTSADIPAAVSEYVRSGAELADIQEVDGLRILVTVRSADLPGLLALAGKRGDGTKILGRRGYAGILRRLGRHPVLIIGVLFLLFLTAFLPTRVLFVEVRGNENIPARRILEQAAQCGVYFGADRGSVRSERTKNALLEAIPELQWAGINTQGCLAVITVEERQIQSREPESGICSLVASRDGVIRQVTALRGTALCAPGQSVRAGEVLISGYTNCGGVLLAQGAEGEVFAETRRSLRAVTGAQWVLRGDFQGSETKISLILGKNRINFYEDSGILDASCVKMYTEYYMTLPGGFRLPLVLNVERRLYYGAAPGEVDPGRTDRILEEGSEAYLLEQMIGGQILEEASVPGEYQRYTEYICLEMIGQIRYEENTEIYGENYGTNR